MRWARMASAAAGLAEPESEETGQISTTPDADDLWDALTPGGPLARAVLALPEDEREASRRAIVGNMERLRNEDGSYTAPAATWGVLVR